MTHERIQSNLWIFTSDYFAKNSKNCTVKIIIIIFKKNNLLTNFWRHHLFRPLENPITKRKKSQITEVTIRYKKNFNFTILGLVSSQSTRLINFNGLENLRCESFFFILSLFFCIFLRFIKKPQQLILPLKDPMKFEILSKPNLLNYDATSGGLIFLYLFYERKWLIRSANLVRGSKNAVDSRRVRFDYKFAEFS